MRIARSALPLVLASTLAGCGESGAAPTPTDARFDSAGSWQLVEANVAGPEVPILDDHPITLTIEGSEISGTAACNSYGGRLTVRDDRLEVEDLGMTAMACEEPAVSAEAAYVSALLAATSIERDGAQLVLRGPEMVLRFDALPEPPTSELVDTAWVLETIFVGDVASSTVGAPATLELRSDGTFTGSTGCRTFSGEWVEEGNQIVAPAWGLDGAECPPELRQQDEHVVSVIGDGFVPTIEADLLTLRDPAGVGLVYREGE
jgi:heat shock protein HslJ